MAVFGYNAQMALVHGEPLDDELLNDIFIHEIRSLPDDTGWILDDYPTTVAQAKVKSACCVFKKNIYQTYVPPPPLLLVAVFFVDWLYSAKTNDTKGFCSIGRY